MTVGTPDLSDSYFHFTAPWDPIVVRRGDALGLRALADQFADALAPDLSNRVRDGRWVTILAWCLVRSHEVFHAAGGRSVETRAQQAERYAWLRPLELLWVARTIALANDSKSRSLAGQRRVKSWYLHHRQKPERFGMSVDQFRAYRQTGMYGGYRVAFRKWPGMTRLGDGWTPDKASHKLANWLDKKLGGARLAGAPKDGAERKRRSPSKQARESKDIWWRNRWKNFDQGGRRSDENTLPRPLDDFGLLPEADLLKPLVFGDDPAGSVRRKVANEVSAAAAGSHIAVCEHLGNVFAHDPRFVLLPHFSRLADAGMAAMDLIAETLRQQSRAKLIDVALRPEAKERCEYLMEAVQRWRSQPRVSIPHIATATRFADAITSSDPAQCLTALLDHHEGCGGGLRWFVRRNGWIEPRTPPRLGSSRYRFRLWSLSRLATQCGLVPRMPKALIGDAEAGEEASTEDFNERQ